jgi:glycogen debranching enzyme
MKFGKYHALEIASRSVLDRNRRAAWTVPAEKLYPHQWLWDSAFIAIGLAHFDTTRAITEIDSVFRGQWRNGMLPHIIFWNQSDYWMGSQFWQSKHHRGAPRQVSTSCITQPPVVALAIQAVARQLPADERTKFIRKYWPKLLAYHRWLYRDRDPLDNGSLITVHPWESGLDTTPPWLQAVNEVRIPRRYQIIRQIGILRASRYVRSDTRHVPADERPDDEQAWRLLMLIAVYKTQGFSAKRMLRKPLAGVHDLTFNSIMVAANRAMTELAEMIAESIPASLALKFQQSELALESLWDEATGQYYSRNLLTGELIKISTFATFMPLFAGSIPAERAAKLVALLASKDYATTWPIPGVPPSAPGFKERRYWEGPTWINMNWLTIRGLEKYGYEREANALRTKTLDLVAQFGSYEYFSTLTGHGLGTNNFSWTAALVLDLLADK